MPHPHVPPPPDLVARLRSALDRVDVEPCAPMALAGAVVRMSDGRSETFGAASDRRNLLAAAKQGQVQELEVTATTYIQLPKSPNRNFSRVQPAKLPALAKSFVGMPVLRDHNTYELEARGGTIIDSKLTREDTPDGVAYAIVMTLRLVKQWAIESALDGTLDRFSVSWIRQAGAEGAVLCSVHGTPVFTDCNCWRGETTKSGKLVEFVYQGVDGIEVSGVNVPAVVGTSIDAIRQLQIDARAQGVDLATLACMLGTSHATPENDTMDPKMLASLGLKPDATPEQIEAAIAALNAAKDTGVVVAGQLAAERTERERLAAQLAGVEVAAGAVAIEARLTALKEAGKLAPGSDTEAALRRIATRDRATFDATCADMEQAGARIVPITPAGGPVVKPVAKLKTVDEVLAADPVLAGYLKNAGLTKAEFEAHGLQAYLDRLARATG